VSEQELPKTPVDREVVPVKTEHRTWDKGGGKQGQAWTCHFEGGAKADTYSENAAKAVEENIGKPLTVTVKVDRDKEGNPKTFRNETVWIIEKIVSKTAGTLYEPGTKGGRGGGGYSQRPDWTYQDPRERAMERASIEAQTAEKVAVEALGVFIAYASDQRLTTEEGALGFIEKAANAARARIAKAREEVPKTVKRDAAASGSGSGSRARPPQGSNKGSPGGESSDRPSSASGARPPASAGDVPAPEPDGAASELAAARTAAVEVFKTPKKVEHAYAAAHGGETKPFAEMTAEELATLAAQGSVYAPEPVASGTSGWA
jgi:hypothetical protein